MFSRIKHVVPVEPEVQAAFDVLAARQEKAWDAYTKATSAKREFVKSLLPDDFDKNSYIGYDEDVITDGFIVTHRGKNEGIAGQSGHSNMARSSAGTSV